MNKSTPSYEISSGNVFADIGVKDAADALAKAELARKIASIIKHRHLIQADAAQLLGIDNYRESGGGERNRAAETGGCITEIT